MMENKAIDVYGVKGEGKHKILEIVRRGKKRSRKLNLHRNESCAHKDGYTD